MKKYIHPKNGQRTLKDVINPQVSGVSLKWVSVLGVESNRAIKNQKQRDKAWTKWCAADKMYLPLQDSNFNYEIWWSKLGREKKCVKKEREYLAHLLVYNDIS